MLGELSEYVAIDLETTGLNQSSDKIIEIGAVRFDAGGLRERFSTFVNPGRPIPPAIQVLTSIEDGDLVGAPPPALAVHELAEFVGNLPVVGHNVQFDLGFLEQAGLSLDGVVFDTYDLAAVLLPTATQLNLDSLTDLLGVELEQHHRALADAEATALVFLRLLERLNGLPQLTLHNLVHLATQSGWRLGTLFTEALVSSDGEDSLKLSEPVKQGIGDFGLDGQEVTATGLSPLRPDDEFVALSDDDVRALFAEARRRGDLLPGFEVRAGQLMMSQAVASSIAHEGHLAVEAGTGTGKSLAYLLPALAHSLRSGERVVISTQTLNLQEQLAEHDMPAAASLVEGTEGLLPGSLRMALLKGRSNYLCVERWSQMMDAESPPSLEQARLLARVCVWLNETVTGDRSELYLRAGDRLRWAEMAADTNDCLARRCQFVREGSCFLQRARSEAAAAHVVVVNHALLLNNAANGDQVLPAFKHLVVDEAHRLEGVATEQFGGSLMLPEIERLIDEVAVGGVSHAAELRDAAKLDPMPLSPAAGLTGLADELVAGTVNLRARLPELEEALVGYIDEFSEGGGERRVLITVGRRVQPLWADVEEGAMHVELALEDLGRRILRAEASLGMLSSNGMAELEKLRGVLMRAADTAVRQADILRQSIQRTDPEMVVWLSMNNRGVRIDMAPLDVAERLEEELWARRKSVLATSATLSTQGSFNFSMRRLGLFDSDTLDVPSPFDYRQAVRVLIVNDLPEPGQPNYEAEAQKVLAEAVRAAEGRTLGLFTSHSGVRSAAAALRGPLAADGVGLLAHDIDGGPARLLRAFAARPRSLVLGTAAFWEGIDIRGPALSQLVLMRLPFPVPTDPIHAARSALYDDPFSEYTLPQAVLRFRQGFGRLIRGSDERGVFLILDRRVTSRRYGDAFLEALPECEQRVLSAADVPEEVEAWLSEYG